MGIPKVKLRPIARVGRRFLSTLKNYPYDVFRWLRYGGWFDLGQNSRITEYRSLMIAHGVEKGLSYVERSAGRGQKRYNDLNDCISEYKNQIDKNILEILVKVKKQYEDVECEIDHDEQHLDGAPIEWGDVELENFFQKRRSHRFFSTEQVTPAEVEKILDLAKYTPSVCNRQAWHMYYSLKTSVIQKFLGYQAGNKPWSKGLNCLFVVTVDQRAFFGGNERYQHYIEGGLFSMQLINAIHALGLVSCPLNWSQFAKKDKEARKEFNIDPHHSIIMCIAVGKFSKQYKPCNSDRRPTDHFMTELECNSN